MRSGVPHLTLTPTLSLKGEGAGLYWGDTLVWDVAMRELPVLGAKVSSLIQSLETPGPNDKQDQS